LKVTLMKPKLFIGSSTQRLPIARALKQMLADSAEVAVWDDPAQFPIGDFILDSLIRVSVNYDFAIVIFGQDDCTMMGGVELPTVRDNVIFELWLFMGQMGRARAFWLSPQGAQAPHIASDLGGIVHLSFKEENTIDAEAIRASLAGQPTRSART
jgi:predicted nucleotide-binding protein